MTTGDLYQSLSNRSAVPLQSYLYRQRTFITKNQASILYLMPTGLNILNAFANPSITIPTLEPEPLRA